MLSKSDQREVTNKHEVQRSEKIEDQQNPDFKVQMYNRVPGADVDDPRSSIDHVSAPSG